jgi:hypothetical protein
MTTKKITETEISELKVASLPTRPTAPTAYGGRGYTAKEMKAAFDKLPLFIASRFNALLDDLFADDESSLAAAMPTGIKDGHTLRELFSDITTGALSEYLTLDGETLTRFKNRLSDLFDEYAEHFATIDGYMADEIIDGGLPTRGKGVREGD